MSTSKPEGPRVFEVRLPTASMPSNEVGQLSFSVEDHGYSFLMPRADFERLARRISQLLAETSAPPSKR